MRTVRNWAIVTEGYADQADLTDEADGNDPFHPPDPPDPHNLAKNFDRSGCGSQAMVAS